MFCVDCSFTWRFCSTYSSTSAFAAAWANFGSRESNRTSTSLLPGTGSTVTCPMKAFTSPDSDGVSSILRVSVASDAAGRTNATMRFSRSCAIVSGVTGGSAVPLNSGMAATLSFLTTRRVRSRPFRMRYCVL